MIKYIHIDYRKPHTKEEKTVYALSKVTADTSSIFVNVDKHRKSKNLSDTFFHEMAHVFLAFHGKEGQMTEVEEEELASHIGHICEEALK